MSGLQILEYRLSKGGLHLWVLFVSSLDHQKLWVVLKFGPTNNIDIPTTAAFKLKAVERSQFWLDHTIDNSLAGPDLSPEKGRKKLGKTHFLSSFSLLAFFFFNISGMIFLSFLI